MLGDIVDGLRSRQWAATLALFSFFAICLKFQPLGFIGLTILATILVMRRNEERIALHQRILYTDRPPTKNTVRRIRFFGFLKGLWIGVLAGALPAIAVAGATSGLDVLSAAVFMACVASAFGVLLWLREKRGIHPLQFGLVKMAFPTGFAYALIQMARPSMKGDEIADKTWDTVKGSLKRDLDTEGIFVTLNSFLTLVDEVLSWVCVRIFGEIWGKICHLFLTVDMAFGISITALALSLLLVWDWMGSRRGGKKATKPT